jgi:hypothetical protein
MSFINDDNFTNQDKTNKAKRITDSNFGNHIIYGIFVVAFDTRLGNVIEWQVPSNLNLEKVEFKAMASGFHLIKNDVVYFHQNDTMFGLAAFESFKIENSFERNVRMKSVGILAGSYRVLKQYESFLEAQVRYQLEKPGDYSFLLKIWNNDKINDFNQYQNNYSPNNQLERAAHFKSSQELSTLNNPVIPIEKKPNLNSSATSFDREISFIDKIFFSSSKRFNLKVI